MNITTVKNKFKITEKKILWTLIVLLFVTTIADLWTAFGSPVFKISESNPLFLLEGGIVTLLILTTLITVFLIRTLFKSISLTKLFIVFMFTIYLCAGHILGATTNIRATQNYYEAPEEYVESMKQLTTDDKMQSYFWLVGLFMLLPIILSSIAFALAHKIYELRKSKREQIVDKIFELGHQLKFQ